MEREQGYQNHNVNKVDIQFQKIVNVFGPIWTPFWVFCCFYTVLDQIHSIQKITVWHLKSEQIFHHSLLTTFLLQLYFYFIYQIYFKVNEHERHLFCTNMLSLPVGAAFGSQFDIIFEHSFFFFTWSNKVWYAELQTVSDNADILLWKCYGRVKMYGWTYITCAANWVFGGVLITLKELRPGSNIFLNIHNFCSKLNDKGCVITTLIVWLSIEHILYAIRYKINNCYESTF